MKRLLLLQVTDSLFPIGGYSHSYGLETYIQKNLVSDGETAKKYIKAYIRHSLCFTELLAIKLAYQVPDGKYGTERLIELEEKLQALKNPAEIRAASNKLATRFLKTVREFSGKEYICFDGKHHYTVAYGVFCKQEDISLTDALTHFAYCQVSALVTNCVKSIPLSQTLGQKLLFDMQPDIEKAVQTAMEAPEEYLGMSAPGLDIRCMQHEDLYARIYMS